MSTNSSLQESCGKEINQGLLQIFAAVQTCMNLLSEIQDPQPRVTKVINLQKLSLSKIHSIMNLCENTGSPILPSSLQESSGSASDKTI